MRLGERKRKILRAVVDDYIMTGEPVGSRTIAKRYNLGISSATIRNEMADLEEMGYLEQPYTSAGRIPSDLGYRLYVDELMDKYEISSDFLKLELNLDSMNLEDIVKYMTKLLSKVTSYTSAAITPQLKKYILKGIYLLPIDKKMVLLLVVTSTGINRECLINLDRELEQGILEKVSNIINDKFAEKEIENFAFDIMDKILVELKAYDYENEIRQILSLLHRNLKALYNKEIFLSGTNNILNFPEYNDVNKAKLFFSVLEDKEALLDVLEPDTSTSIKITIGKENKYEELKECSVLKATYSVDDKVLGSIGFIGPKRMEYSKLIAILNKICEDLNTLLSRYI